MKNWYFLVFYQSTFQYCYRNENHFENANIMSKTMNIEEVPEIPESTKILEINTREYQTHNSKQRFEPKNKLNQNYFIKY